MPAAFSVTVLLELATFRVDDELVGFGLDCGIAGNTQAKLYLIGQFLHEL